MELFQRAVNTFLETTKMDVSTFSYSLGISYSTADRWMSGQSAPHHLIRDKTYTYMIDYLADQMQSLQVERDGK